MSKFLVYALVCPRSGGPRYVGQTSLGGKVRFAQHLLGLKSPDNCIYKKRWVQTLLDRGLRPKLVILLALPTEEHLDAAEIFWIKELKSRGCHLTNLTAGGGGTRGYQHAAEAKEKMAAAKRGVPKTAEHREKLRLAQTGKVLSPEVRAKIGAAQVGRPVSEATREKLRLAKSGSSHSPETKAKMSVSAKARCARV